MPVYEFKCTRCGTTFSSLRRMGEDRNVQCEKCGSPDTNKLISSFSGGKSSTHKGPSCAQSGGG
ncbi:MAG: zinc ribbon domain-containing protein [Chrysiogenales bacterium]|nr:MAG: zinc ribbon domain-containing protein [Chrysiogenales bacterium]